MEMISKTKKFKMVDEMGIIREISVTVEHEKGILVEVAIPRYVDEDGHYKDFIGQYVPRDMKHPRVDITGIKGRSAEDDERCSQTHKAVV